MNKQGLAKLAKTVIKTNQYISLGTVNAKNKPWVSPVYYCHDTTYTLYYASQLDSVHTKNIFYKPDDIACAIFSTSAGEGGGVGVQMTAKAELVKEKDLQKALKTYKSSFVTPDMLTEKGPYKLFKLTPKRVYVTDPDAKVDKRVEVTI